MSRTLREQLLSTGLISEEDLKREEEQKKKQRTKQNRKRTQNQHSSGGFSERKRSKVHRKRPSKTKEFSGDNSQSDSKASEESLSSKVGSLSDNRASERRESFQKNLQNNKTNMNKTIEKNENSQMKESSKVEEKIVDNGDEMSQRKSLTSVEKEEPQGITVNSEDNRDDNTGDISPVDRLEAVDRGDAELTAESAEFGDGGGEALEAKTGGENISSSGLESSEGEESGVFGESDNDSISSSGGLNGGNSNGDSGEGEGGDTSVRSDSLGGEGSDELENSGVDGSDSDSDLEGIGGVSEGEESRAAAEVKGEEDSSVFEAVERIFKNHTLGIPIKGLRKWYFLTRDGRFQYFRVSKKCSEMLSGGDAAIVEIAPNRFRVISREGAEKIAELAPDYVRFWNR